MDEPIKYEIRGNNNFQTRAQAARASTSLYFFVAKNIQFNIIISFAYCMHHRGPMGVNVYIFCCASTKIDIQLLVFGLSVAFNIIKDGEVAK